jgi:hypothetical protein
MFNVHAHHHPHSMTARIVSLFINACLFLSVLAFIMGTMPEFKCVLAAKPLTYWTPCMTN